MRRIRTLTVLLGVAMLLAPFARAQEKQFNAESVGKGILVKVQVVLTEFDGDKKITSLPYSFVSDASGRNVSLRMGLKVPITTDAKTGQVSFTYMDVGTSIDWSSLVLEAGGFSVGLTVNRSSVYSAVLTDSKGGSTAVMDSSQVSGNQPVIRNFSSNLRAVMKDGQTIESTVATDPLSGHILKVAITLSVMK